MELTPTTLSGNTHRVHSHHVGSRGFKSGNNAVIVIIRVGIHLRIPNDLLRIDRFPVYNGADLPVASAGVKANAAAIKIPADFDGTVQSIKLSCSAPIAGTVDVNLAAQPGALT